MRKRVEAGFSPPAPAEAGAYTSIQLVAIGCSTGGPPALQHLFESLPLLPLPIVVAQHMPAQFTRLFAERIDRLSKYAVKEAEDGELLKAGGNKIVLPVDHLIANKPEASAQTKIVDSDIPEGWLGMDIGPQTITRYQQEIAKAGTVSLTVTNPPPGGGVSDSVVLELENPVPVITSIEPIEGGTKLRIVGSGFMADSVVSVNGVAKSAPDISFVNATELTITHKTASGEKIEIEVSNPEPGGGTAKKVS